MKKIITLMCAAAILVGCGSSGNGELVGVQKRQKFHQPDPYGMVYIPMGSYTMGIGSEDVPTANMRDPKTITVTSFFMDETEITNNEYRQFVHWVRDSIARRLLVSNMPDEFADYIIQPKNEDAAPLTPEEAPLNWKKKIDWENEQVADVLENQANFYLPREQRFFRQKQVDARNLNYKYYWVDLRKAAGRNPELESDPSKGMFDRRDVDRRDLVFEDEINIYPDTLVWIHDFTYTHNDPIVKRYFWHPSYDHYPVVGVNWKQARAFAIWRSQLQASYLHQKGKAASHEFRLPTENEWEWAARGGFEGNPYPWGGPYTRNAEGCFLANFKPLRGNYIADGGALTVIVGHYEPNDFGLYDMAGNVAEWTSDTYDELADQYKWDFNPYFGYEAKDDDPIALKRKVIRGGSWKDIAYFLRVTTRAYEYQDTAKSYIGFRCVQDYLGRQKGDKPSKSSHVY